MSGEETEDPQYAFAQGHSPSPPLVQGPTSIGTSKEENNHSKSAASTSASASASTSASASASASVESKKRQRPPYRFQRDHVHAIRDAIGWAFLKPCRWRSEKCVCPTCLIKTAEICWMCAVGQFTKSGAPHQWQGMVLEGETYDLLTQTLLDPKELMPGHPGHRSTCKFMDHPQESNNDNLIRLSQMEWLEPVHSFLIDNPADEDDDDQGLLSPFPLSRFAVLLPFLHVDLPPSPFFWQIHNPKRLNCRECESFTRECEKKMNA